MMTSQAMSLLQQEYDKVTIMSHKLYIISFLLEIVETHDTVPITALMLYRSSWHVFIPWYISVVQIKMQYVQISNIMHTFI